MTKASALVLLCLGFLSCGLPDPNSPLSLDYSISFSELSSNIYSITVTPNASTSGISSLGLELYYKLYPVESADADFQADFLALSNDASQTLSVPTLANRRNFSRMNRSLSLNLYGNSKSILFLPGNYPLIPMPSKRSNADKSFQFILNWPNSNGTGVSVHYKNANSDDPSGTNPGIDPNGADPEIVLQRQTTDSPFNTDVDGKGFYPQNLVFASDDRDAATVKSSPSFPSVRVGVFAATYGISDSLDLLWSPPQKIGLF